MTNNNNNNKQQAQDEVVRTQPKWQRLGFSSREHYEGFKELNSESAMFDTSTSCFESDLYDDSMQDYLQAQELRANLEN